MECMSEGFANSSQPACNDLVAVSKRDLNLSYSRCLASKNMFTHV